MFHRVSGDKKVELLPSYNFVLWSDMAIIIHYYYYYLIVYTYVLI